MPEDGKYITSDDMEAQGPTEDSLPTDSLGQLDNLLREENRLVDLMQRRTHALTRRAFEWKEAQRLIWDHQWEEGLTRLKNLDHNLYYFTVKDGDQQLVFEVFEPYLRRSSSRFTPGYLCVIEYVVSPANPLEFDHHAVIGANTFATNGRGQIPESFKVAIDTNALAISAFGKEYYPIGDSFNGEHRLSGSDSNFGWDLPNTSLREESLYTGIGGNPLPKSDLSKVNVFYKSSDLDIFATAQRRLDLLAKAELIGVSKPPERVITPYTKG